MKLYIKDMLSPCCRTAVELELKKFGAPFMLSDFGEIHIQEELTAWQREQLKTALIKAGLELIKGRKSILVEKIKSAIVTMVREEGGLATMKASDYLAEKLNHGYAYLSNIFSEVTGNTIEYYTIARKIEQVKTLLREDQLTLTEISYLLNYSSVAHLSSQFKKVTGLTPSSYKKVEKERHETLGRRWE